MARRTAQVTTALIVASLVLGIAPNALARRRRDIRPPSVTVAAPTAGGVDAGQIVVSGSAYDNVAVARVAIGVDGTNYATASGTNSWSGPVDTSAYPDGTHLLTVKAWDRRGNVRKSSVSVTFSNGSSDPAPATSKTLVTPEGTTIEIDSSGAWTADQVYKMLKENGLDSTVGPSLTVKVQDVYASQTSMSVSSSGGVYSNFKATMYLQGANSSSFVTQPDATVGHEYGHVWSLYHLYMTKKGDWNSYLDARGLAGDSRLDSSYGWSRREIIADDYRLLFGSASAISERSRHLNPDIPDPRDVAGLREFLSGSWTTAS